MKTRTLPLAVVILSVLIASCGSQPGVSVSIASQNIPMVPASVTKSVGCSVEHGDYFPRQIPLTVIRNSVPVRLQLEAGQGATEIRGVIYDVEATLPSGGPIEEFAVQGRSGTHEARAIASGRTYQVLIHVKWSFLLTSGEESHLFRVRIDPP